MRSGPSACRPCHIVPSSLRRAMHLHLPYARLLVSKRSHRRRKIFLARSIAIWIVLQGSWCLMRLRVASEQRQDHMVGPVFGVSWEAQRVLW